jgi:uncharacterized protein YprB with RNaseH-like and TPR domain
MDLRDKLKQFDRELGLKSNKTVRSKKGGIEQVVSGEETVNDFGSFFRSVKIYPEDYEHGKMNLKLIWDVDPEIFSLVGKDGSLKSIDFNKVVFIDTETTGLAGGAGTVPFLIGIGFFTENGFQIEQFFMRDYNEERALLEAVSNRLKTCQTLVSYNGKCFDMNLLASRFTMARMTNPATDIPHLDLLFTVRRLWRRRIADCSLSNVERIILNFDRNGDIPGYMIPGIYFDYLRTGRATSMADVFRHNQWDIVTLAALAILTGKIYSDPVKHLNHAQDLLSIGKALEGVSRLEPAVECYRETLNLSVSKEEKEEALTSLGFTLKRLCQWERAVQVWEHMINKLSYRLIPYEELAKYYEHRTSEFKNAIDVVEKALERISYIENLPSNFSFARDREELEYRLARLERKNNRFK